MNKKTLDEAIKEALEDAPKIEGYKIKQISDICEVPWPPHRWHLELLEASGAGEHFRIKRKKN